MADTCQFQTTWGKCAEPRSGKSAYCAVHDDDVIRAARNRGGLHDGFCGCSLCAPSGHEHDGNCCAGAAWTGVSC